MASRYFLPPMSGHPIATRISRRRMLVASGAAVSAPFAFYACGSEDELEARSEANDPDLLNAVLAQQLAVEEVARSFTKGREPTTAVGSAAQTLAATRKKSISQLEAFIAEREGEPTADPAETVAAESPPEALARQLEASIEASLGVIGDLSSATYRQAVHRYITEDAAALAAMRSVLGEDVVPDAFVFGPASTEDGDG
jgi:hypothetical protein